MWVNKCIPAEECEFTVLCAVDLFSFIQTSPEDFQHLKEPQPVQGTKIWYCKKGHWMQLKYLTGHNLSVLFSPIAPRVLRSFRKAANFASFRRVKLTPPTAVWQRVCLECGYLKIEDSVHKDLSATSLTLNPYSRDYITWLLLKDTFLWSADGIGTVVHTCCRSKKCFQFFITSRKRLQV